VRGRTFLEPLKNTMLDKKYLIEKLLNSSTTRFNHLCTGLRIDVDIDDFESIVFILVAPCHSLISIHTQAVFHIPEMIFFTPFSKIMWFRLPTATLILCNASVLFSTIYLDFCCMFHRNGVLQTTR
jgi:hypothetical protein